MLENHDREDYVRAHIVRGADGGLIALPFPSQDNSMLLTLAQADGLIRRRPRVPASPRGTPIDVFVFDRLGSPY
jgi:molybdopterin molybdotransferase